MKHCAASPGRLRGGALRYRDFRVPRTLALRVCCRAGRAMRRPWRVHVDQIGHGRISHASSSRLRRPACAVCLRMSGFSRARYAPMACCDSIWRHASRASLSSSGAHPPHVRPGCCLSWVVRTHPVRRPGRVAQRLAARMGSVKRFTEHPQAPSSSPVRALPRHQPTRPPQSRPPGHRAPRAASEPPRATQRPSLCTR